jgi:hypothetical protein
MRLLGASYFAFACALSAPTVRASTYTVDAGGGGQFTDIQSAIAAAQTGDVIFVIGGSYGGFTLDKGLVVLGDGGVLVNGAVQLANVSAGTRAVVARMQASHVTVSGCAGAIVMQSLSVANRIVVTQSNDVRLASVTANSGPGSLLSALTIDASRVEIVDSTLQGGQGADAGAGTNGQSGGAGMQCAPATRVHVARSNVAGGWGGDSFILPLYSGGGGPGIAMTSSCEVFLVGPGTSVGAGYGGLAIFGSGFECWAYGGDACAVSGAGSLHRDAGSVLTSSYTDICSYPFHLPPVCGPADLQLVPPDPSLRVAGNLTPGSTATFTLYGEPGASALLNLGRNLILAPTPGVAIEQLAPANRVIPLGTIPASGSVTRTMLLPATFSPGLTFVAQGEVTGTNGLRRTNSTPIVVR